jgi:hypothetical protein
MFRFMILAVLSLGLLSGCKDNKSFDDGPSTVNKTNAQGQFAANQQQPPQYQPPAQPPMGGGTGPIVNTGGGGGAVQSTRKAVGRTVDANDLKNIQIFIENASGATGQMPDRNTIMAALKSEPGAAKVAKMIEEGDIILTGIRQREGVWAYPKDVLTNGGMIVTNQGVERVSNVELQNRLKMQ